MDGWMGDIWALAPSRPGCVADGAGNALRVWPRRATREGARARALLSTSCAHIPTYLPTYLPTRTPDDQSGGQPGWPAGRVQSAAISACVVCSACCCFDSLRRADCVSPDAAAERRERAKRRGRESGLFAAILLILPSLSRHSPARRAAAAHSSPLPRLDRRDSSPPGSAALSPFRLDKCDAHLHHRAPPCRSLLYLHLPLPMPEDPSRPSFEQVKRRSCPRAANQDNRLIGGRPVFFFCLNFFFLLFLTYHALRHVFGLS
ncbi:hypothetical protein GGS23DRAFT_88260 [Durotheca rogersii]|uniref:uncharacterized protein n=1 Tax=Durotheca rogersii TaxID=419775 RepID=UPI0022205E2A|nr:uncharacterized protein GGS23DRAFT_88260 [Durotheca rogersii]KAI5862697.1 hypothetical protein GGS23DRAFT_88260 [Durotheca rogersii]